MKKLILCCLSLLSVNSTFAASRIVDSSQYSPSIRFGIPALTGAACAAALYATDHPLAPFAPCVLITGIGLGAYAYKGSCVLSSAESNADCVKSQNELLHQPTSLSSQDISAFFEKIASEEKTRSALDLISKNLTHPSFSEESKAVCLDVLPVEMIPSLIPLFIKAASSTDVFRFLSHMRNISCKVKYLEEMIMQASDLFLERASSQNDKVISADALIREYFGNPSFSQKSKATCLDLLPVERISFLIPLFIKAAGSTDILDFTSYMRNTACKKKYIEGIVAHPDLDAGFYTENAEKLQRVFAFSRAENIRLELGGEICCDLP